MRIWDINPGYLNRQSLLGEHRDLHGIVAIIRNNNKGYSRHPETIRWAGYGWALKQRHNMLVAEMNLRGYTDRSPVLLRANKHQWPTVFIDTPGAQSAVICKKYKALESGRIPIPKNVQQLWAQHKYSVMARDIPSYKSIGKWVASKGSLKFFDELFLELISLLRNPPNSKLIANALLHMWGYVSEYSTTKNSNIDSVPTMELLNRIQQLTISYGQQYLIHSTALSELGAWNR